MSEPVKLSRERWAALVASYEIVPFIGMSLVDGESIRQSIIVTEPRDLDGRHVPPRRVCAG